jgi:hypothetical protein
MADPGKDNLDKPIPLPEEELEIAFSGPAIAANKVYATRTNAGLRLAFTEQRNPTAAPIFRTAVLMPFQDAIGLRDLLSRLLRDIEMQLQKAVDESQKSN